MTPSVSRDSKIFRMILSLGLAATVSLALFTVMYLLIYSNIPDIKDEQGRKIADIFLGERTITTRSEEEIERPEEAEAPPEIIQPKNQEFEVKNNPINMTITMKDPTIDHEGMLSSEGEYLPIVKIAPIYPRRALTRGIEGHCTVGYTVTTSGAVRDPYIVDCPNPVFRNASLRAALKFKYKPRVIGGEALEVVGVQNRFTYELTR